MLYEHVADSAQRQKTDGLEVYDFYYMGVKLLQTEYDEASLRQMAQYFGKAVEKDPDFALAYVGLGWLELISYWGGWSSDPEQSLQKASEYAEKGLALDDNQARTHLLLGDVYASMGQLDRGVAEHAKSRALNPNDPDIKSESAAYLAYAGQVDAAIDLISDAMRLNPFYPDRYLWDAAIAHYPAHEYDAVIDAVERMREPGGPSAVPGGELCAARPPA